MSPGVVTHAHAHADTIAIVAMYRVSETLKSLCISRGLPRHFEQFNGISQLLTIIIN